MNHAYRISTGIDSLDQTLDYLRPGDNVTWQMESIGDYAFVATQFVTKIALTGMGSEHGEENAMKAAVEAP